MSKGASPRIDRGQPAQVAMICSKILVACVWSTHTLPSLTGAVIFSTGSGISEVNVDMRGAFLLFLRTSRGAHLQQPPIANGGRSGFGLGHSKNQPRKQNLAMLHDDVIHLAFLPPPPPEAIPNRARAMISWQRASRTRSSNQENIAPFGPDHDFVQFVKLRGQNSVNNPLLERIMILTGA